MDTCAPHTPTNHPPHQGSSRQRYAAEVNVDVQLPDQIYRIHILLPQGQLCGLQATCRYLASEGNLRNGGGGRADERIEGRDEGQLGGL